MKQNENEVTVRQLFTEFRESCNSVRREYSHFGVPMKLSKAN
jgi:hypothetical protein